MSLLEDLIEHTNKRRTVSIKQAMQLLDDGDDIVAFLVGIAASDLASLTQAFAQQDEAFPLFCRLPYAQQVYLMAMLLSGLVSREQIDLSVQTMSNLIAAKQEIMPQTEIVVRG